MHTSLVLTVAAGLSVTAARAESDPNVWRWYVSNALQGGASVAPLREGRASAIEKPRRFVQHYERYLADGSPAPIGELPNH